MSKASRRSSQTTRGAAGRPTGAAPAGGDAAVNPTANPDGAPAGTPADAARLGSSSRASSARAGGTRPSGTRAGGTSRPRRSLYQPSFYERHRTALLGGVAAVVVVVVAAFLFFSLTASAYGCSTITQPAPAGTPLPNGSPAPLGQAQPDMGQLHIAAGATQRYSYCPPASGPHYNAQDLGPIAAKYYGPDDGTRPEGWIHNLEHGGMVILYNCSMGACTDANAATLQALAANFPNSPICGIHGGDLSPVIARFDSMAAPFAAVVWDKVFYLNTLDTNQILEFYKTQDERTNPEPQCGRPTASPAATPSVSPASSASGVPSSQPSSSPTPAPSPSSS